MISLGYLERARKKEENSCFGQETEVWKNRLCVNEERDCSERAEFLPAEYGSTQLTFTLPFSTITMKQETQTQILPLMNPGDMEE